MKRKVAFMAFLMALFLSGGPLSFAQGLGKKLAIGARASYLGIASDGTPLGEIDSDGTLFLEGNVTFFAANSFSLEFSGGYGKSDLDLKRPGVFVKWGELEQIPLLLTGRYHWWNEIPLVGFYIGGGAGYYFNDFEVSDAFRSLHPGAMVEVDDSFGVHVAGGFEYFISKDVAVNVDLKYIFNDADVVKKEPGLADLSFDLDLDTFIGGVGIKFYF